VFSAFHHIVSHSGFAVRHGPALLLHVYSRAAPVLWAFNTEAAGLRRTSAVQTTTTTSTVETSIRSNALLAGLHERSPGIKSNALLAGLHERRSGIKSNALLAGLHERSPGIKSNALLAGLHESSSGMTVVLIIFPACSRL